MSKTDIKHVTKEIVKVYYPEIGNEKYVPKLPEISEEALIELEAAFRSMMSHYPKALEYTYEILSFIDAVKDERAKR